MSYRKMLWIGSAILMAVLIAHADPALAVGADRYVSSLLGSDQSNDCTAPGRPCETIQHALDLADFLDVIKVHAGSYEENILVQRRLSDVSLEGGWSSTFDGRFPGITTTISGLDQGPVIELSALSTTIHLSIDRFTLERGDNEQGGAISAYARSGGSQPIYGGHIVLTLTDSVIRDSTALYGGAIRAIADTPAVGFNDNSVTLILTGNEITNNHSAFLGGAIAVSGGVYSSVNVELSDNIIDSNTTGQDGGGIIVDSHDPDGTGVIFTLKRNVITQNSSGRSGGGVALVSSGVGPSLALMSMENNIVANNSAVENGGGIYLHAQWGKIDLQLVNDTVSGNDTDNSTSAHGAGIHASAFGGIMDIDAVNSILTPNHRHPVGALDLFMESGVSLTSDYSMMGTVGGGGFHDPGDHNLTAGTSPAFVDSANSDYHLRPDSPAIDAGICGLRRGRYVRIAPYEDFEGDPRPGLGALTTCDMGADEYVPEPGSTVLGIAASACLALLASRRRRASSQSR